MSVGWSADAQAELRKNTFRHEWQVFLDIETSGGAYGSYVYDVTDRVVKAGKIIRQTSIIEKDFKMGQTTWVFNNHDGYLSPNRFLVRDDVDNVWQYRDTGEASPYDCKMRVDLKLYLPDGATETKTFFQGKIKEISHIHEGDLLAVEITAVWDQLDPLDQVFTHEDGKSVTHVVT